MIALETRRLLLLPAHPRLARAALEYYTRNRDWLQPWEPAYPPDLCTLACQKKRMRWDRDMARRGEGIRFWLARKEDPGTLIGTAIFVGHLAGTTSAAMIAEAARAAPRPDGPPRAPDLLLDGLARRFTDGYSAGVPPLE